MGIFEDCVVATEKPSNSKIDIILRNLSEEDGKSLMNALVEPSISAATIADVLRKRNISVSKDAIINWRRKNQVGIK